MSDGAHSSTTKTALIVDDDPILREIMAAKLKEAGFAVDCVEDGEVACDRLDSERYSLALVDLNMPRLDGFGLLRHIRQNPRTVDLPVIVVTANDDRTSIEKAYALGASSFMTKPVNWSQFIHHIRFVTRSGETEQALRRAQAEAEAASRMKNGLFHLLSHELRTPVSVLVGFAGLLESTLGRPHDVEQTDHLNHIVEAAQRLNAIIGDILLYSKTLSGPSKLDINEWSAIELIEDAVTALKGKAHEKRISLSIRVPFDDLTVACDAKLAHRALSKLLDNAIKFSPPGASVEIAAHGERGSAVMSIRDSGPGMSKKKLAECLQPFVQADMSWGRPAEGLGLGLPIARFIAEAHGGELICKTAPGKGMIAALWFPAQSAAKTARAG
jgi:two-component system, sensor histidine kinase and response regulator